MFILTDIFFRVKVPFNFGLNDHWVESLVSLSSRWDTQQLLSSSEKKSTLLSLTFGLSSYFGLDDGQLSERLIQKVKSLSGWGQLPLRLKA